MSRAVTLGVLLAVAAAFALRCPQPASRPMHNDEAINAIKFRDLWEHGAFQYDPGEFHGPTLYYLTFAWEKLTGAPRDFSQFSESRFRVVTVLFGVGLVLLLPLIADGLGRRATVWAAFFTAISPAMVFYSRYFIHEMLLVFFTLLTLVAGWRYWQSRRPSWAKVRSGSQYTESRLSAPVQLFQNLKAFTYEAWQLFLQRGGSESAAGCSTRFSVSP